MINGTAFSFILNIELCFDRFLCFPAFRLVCSIFFPLPPVYIMENHSIKTECKATELDIFD